MTTQYQNTLTIGRYVVQESLSDEGLFTLIIENTVTGKTYKISDLSFEQFDQLIGLLSQNKDADNDVIDSLKRRHF